MHDKIRGLQWLAGIGGMVNGWLLLFHPTSFIIRPLPGTSFLLGVEGVMVFFLGVGVFLNSRGSALILFFYILFGKVLLSLALRHYYALIPDLIWLCIYYEGVVGTFSQKKRF